MGDNSPTPPLLVTVREASRMLSVSGRTLWDLTRRGVIPSVRIGRGVRYSIDALERFVRQRREANRPIVVDAATPVVGCLPQEGQSCE